jgi:hypothetical protein
MSLSIRQTTSRRQRVGIFLSSKTSDQHWNPPSLLFMGYRKLLRRRLSGQDVRLTTHLHPVHSVYRVTSNFYNTTAIQTISATPPSDALKALRPKLVNYGVGQPRRPATNAKPHGKYLAKTNIGTNRFPSHKSNIPVLLTPVFFTWVLYLTAPFPNT